MADENGWLIERTRPERGMPEYISIVGWYDGLSGGGRLQWSGEHQHALRFARQEDAAKFVGMIRLLSDDLPHIKTVPGLRSDDPLPMISEHGWMGATPQERGDA
jgi:hypothetical protein